MEIDSGSKSGSNVDTFDSARWSEVLSSELSNLLKIKERLLKEALDKGTVLRRDDPEFLEGFRRLDELLEKCQDREKKDLARIIQGHIRQFNPFNSTDVDENDVVQEVIEDFLHFHRARIQKLGSMR